MARVCELTGKRPVTGNKVSHSNSKSKRRFYPNLQKKKFYIPEEDRWVTLTVATTAIKTITKKGITQFLRDMKKKGKAVKI